MNLSLLNSLRQVGKAPPIGLWSTEIQERCYCFKTFLANYSHYLDSQINPNLDSIMQQLSQEARQSCNGDWPEYCAILLEEDLVPPDINKEAFEAACKYLVTGEGESLFIPPPLKETARQHVKELYRKWLDNQYKT